MKRKYNRNFYKGFKKGNKKIREKIRPNSFLYLEKTGFFGKIVGLIGNKKIKKPIHMLNRNLVGLYYNPKIDHPVKGSILYTLFDFIIYGFLFIFITTIVQLFM